MYTVLQRHSYNPLLTVRRLNTSNMRVFSGIQPTGTIHLGNYLGAIKKWKDLQDTYPSCLFSVVDLHSLTTEDGRKDLKRTTLRSTCALLASGIDPKKCTLFNQSKVPSHSELMWILSCVTPMHKLNSMIQFKEKSRKAPGEAQVGLLTYPVLMAADILLYRATHVPVGDDQTQHLELARELARKGNNMWDPELFVVPETILTPLSRVLSLTDAKNKMSKSDPIERSRITLADTRDEIATKIARAKTDSIEGISYDCTDRAELANLLRIFSELSGRSLEDITKEYEHKNMKEFKTGLTEVVVGTIGPISDTIKEYEQNLDYVEAVLQDGAKKASEISNQNMEFIRQKVGLV